MHDSLSHQRHWKDPREPILQDDLRWRRPLLLAPLAVLCTGHRGGLGWVVPWPGGVVASLHGLIKVARLVRCAGQVSSHSNVQCGFKLGVLVAATAARPLLTLIAAQGDGLVCASAPQSKPSPAAPRTCKLGPLGPRFASGHEQGHRGQSRGLRCLSISTCIWNIP